MRTKRLAHSSMVFLFIGAALVLAAACSSGPEVDTTTTPKTKAEGMIAGELASTIGLGPLVGICSDPETLAVGAPFGCSATTEPGDVIQLAGVVNDEGRLQLTTTNLISVAAIPSFEREAAATLNDSVGSNFTVQSVDCGDVPIVLRPDFMVGCALIMPSSGQVFDLTLTITDLDARRFSLVVGETPRS